MSKPSPEELEELTRSCKQEDTQSDQDFKIPENGVAHSYFLQTPRQKKQITLARSIERAERIAEEERMIKREQEERKKAAYTELKERTYACYYKSE